MTEAGLVAWDAVQIWALPWLGMRARIAQRPWRNAWPSLEDK
jgi:hypothetical protein